MRFEVLILGSSSATPIYGRHPTAQLININEQLYLLDCGEGTQVQLIKYGIRSNRIKHIFISHLHGDHYLGLIGLISSMHLVGRKEELHIYGPPALQEIIDLHFLHSQTVLRYPLLFHPTQDQTGESILENEHILVSSFPLDHRIACTGFRFDEKKRMPTIDRTKTEAIGIPTAYLPLIKRGNDYTASDGTVYRWQELTLPPPIPRSYAYCSDTVMTERYLPFIQGVDLLYHEATFLHDMLNRAVETFHTTARQAGQIATKVQARKLLIGHYSARYKDLKPLLEESKSIFPNTDLALEGNWYNV
ncbi:ribonuclease Z [Parapedobacter defluvii]|uniref:Ribonuclease Z n=1 Tax=Parapedobacter defluvii TaxID=2045106 RepID=A0ABQ1L1T3_9SPHI|nr:ribonuclease Z [Parapedobacter defluvii]RQP19496.1 MAG: ribonuclease Z [Parapedobacter sp.]GGC15715.1 ribonuclease Z [Parapedobacter defluvii]